MTEKAARIGDRSKDRFEHIGRKLLRDQPDARAGSAPIGREIMAEGGDRPAARAHQSANGPDQRSLARAVGAEQRENLALADIEIDIVESPGAAGIDLAEAGDREDALGH